MPKLHELLAVEGPLKAQSVKVRGDLATLFEKKAHHFTERRKTFTPNSEQGGETIEEEAQTMQSTVRGELAWFKGLWSKALDASLHVQTGCQAGRANIVLDNGATLVADVPVLALLELEKRAAELHEFVGKIPTLDPVKNFEADPNRAHVYKARDVRKQRTVKDAKVVVLFQPTKEHPGKGELVPYDKPIGEILEQEWSGLITPREKAAMLERTDELQRAIKAARTRANEISVDTDRTLGDSLLRYAFDGA